MRRAVARGAVAMAALHALVVLGCRGSEPPPARHAAPSPAEGPDGPAAPPLEELPVVRVDPSFVPVVRFDARTRGPASAPVTIQVFSDFECPYCAMAVPVLRAIEADFGAEVRIVWRDFPLPGHAHARRAAAAATEVYLTRGGAAFWRVHDALFETQASGGLDAAIIDRLATREGIVPERYSAAVTSGVHDTRIDADITAGIAAGVDGTPAFLVNDLLAVGLLPYEILLAVVDRARSERARRLALSAELDHPGRVLEQRVRLEAGVRREAFAEELEVR